MAVRAFDLTEPQVARLRGLDGAPPRRRELRRTKQRYAVIAVLGLATPFVAAIVALGVAH
ncbi:MAG: hypothetical protein HKL86_04490 [Acidimicrobiaceae bacterium]|nr:hypothetical protein [Acidimicrobiaceae bacterium]